MKNEKQFQISIGDFSSLNNNINNDSPVHKNQNPLDNASVKYSQIDNYLIPKDYDEKQLQSELILYNKAINHYCGMKNDVISSLGKSTKARLYEHKTLYELIEQTYGYQRSKQQQMEEECAYLKQILSSWRGVAGDGNCFYRSAIFSYLENLVFASQIKILRHIIADIYNIFIYSNNTLNKLPSSIKSQFKSIDLTTTINILYIIICLLEQNKIENAYLVLLLGFNYKDGTMDKLMIMYLRYLLYDFISLNQDKVFSKDFPVLLGNLLPAEYETENGTFLFDKYFYKDLLVYYTCAEKIAVYLTPFVLKVDLNVVFYSFGNDCHIETKVFKCYLKRPTLMISVLFRTGHYDVAYLNKYIEIHEKKFRMEKKHIGEIYVIDVENVKKREEELKRNGFIIKDSQVFDRKLMIKKMKEEKEKQLERERQIEIEKQLEIEKQIEKLKQLEMERQKQLEQVKVNQEIINENKNEVYSDSYDTDCLLNDLEDDTISMPSSLSNSSETSDYGYYYDNSF